MPCVTETVPLTHGSDILCHRTQAIHLRTAASKYGRDKPSREPRPTLPIPIEHLGEVLWLENLNVLTPAKEMPAHLERAASVEPDDQ